MKKFICMVLAAIFCLSVLTAQKIDVYSRPIQSERSHDYDAFHYLIKINLDIENKTFQGETTVSLYPLKENFSRCALDAEEFTVTSIVNHWGETLAFEQTDTELFVQLAKSYKYREMVSFTVAYYGREPKVGLRYYEKSENKPAMVASDSWPNNVHHWFPCYDYPNDKVTSEVIATVKRGLKVASNGRLVSVIENHDKESITYHWLQDLPHSTYLIFLAAAPYVIVRDNYGTIPINYWVYPQHKDHARISFKDTPKMMAFFNRIYGYDYPWAKYDQVVVPFGGGAESTTATAMGQRIIHDEKAEKDYSNIGIVSHELAHQWWGDLITLRSWEHAWMNESFGTYSDYLYYRFDRGEDEGAVNLLRKKNSYLREAHNRYIRPIVFNRYNRPSDNFDSHSYPKGAVVLHMLRSLIGDDAFFRTLKTFLHNYAFQPVDTHDFQKTVKTVTGQNLDWFFDQWLFRPGHPILDIRYTVDDKAGNTTVKVIQTQDTSKKVPIYKMPVKIGIVTTQGKKSYEVWLRKKEETFEFPTEQKILMVRFDVGNFLLKEWSFKKSLEELSYQLKHDDVIGRMWAATELEKFKDKSTAISNLVSSAREDKFWAVRRNAVQTLGKSPSDKLIPLFKTKSMDQNSKVRNAALVALGEFQKADLVNFFKEKFNHDDSYLVQAEALRAMGKCGDKSIVPFLMKASLMPSPRSIFKNAAQQALKTLGIE